jgi:tetratricopeptide (TPR) repeat protein
MGDLAWMSLSLTNLAEMAMELGDTARARETATRGLELAREVGDRREAGLALIALAWVALDEYRFDEARELFIDALALAHEISNLPDVRGALQGLAAVAAATCDGPLAARLGAIVEPAVAGHAFITPAQSALVERHLAAVRAETDTAEWEEAWRGGATLSLEQATTEILGATVVG